jgi:hypothetical protein
VIWLRKAAKYGNLASHWSIIKWIVDSQLFQLNLMIPGGCTIDLLFRFSGDWELLLDTSGKFGCTLGGHQIMGAKFGFGVLTLLLSAEPTPFMQGTVSPEPSTIQDPAR